MQTTAPPQSIAFGPFLLDLDGRALLAGGERLALSSRAFDILVFLVTERERVVGKEEIMARVWRGVAVEENNLAVQISSLRRVLGEHADGQTLIATIPGQGYRFVGRVEPRPEQGRAPEADAQDASAPVEGAVPRHPGASAPRRRWAILGVGGVLCVALLLLAAQYLSRSPPPPRLSLAVLPFRNLGEDSRQDYLADAISDDLTTDLSHLPGSRVIARESSDVYKGRAMPAVQIGRELQVRYLLEGSLRAVEGMFHINAQLIDASNGAHLWAAGFDVPRDRLRDAQTAIVGHIANALNVELVAIESTRSLHERPGNPDALDLFLRARSIHDTAQSLEQLTQAQKLLERALALQPDYVDALGELSLVLLEKSKEHDDPDDSADRAEADDSVAHALSLEPTNVTALTAQGFSRNMQLRLEASEASYKAALAVDPNNVLARANLAYDDWRLGRYQATVDGYTEVLRLDPQGPAAKKRFSSLGMAYFMTGHFDTAIDYLQRGLSGTPSASSAGVDRIEFSNMFLIAAYDRLGRKDQARALYEQYRQQWPHRSVWRLAAYFSKTQVDSPPFRFLADGLEDAGMPRFTQKPGALLRDVTTTMPMGDFDPAPSVIPGAEFIDVGTLATSLQAPDPPAIVDVGSGAAVIAGAVWVNHLDDRQGGLDQALLSLPRHRGLVVVGDGFYGWSGHIAVQRLLAAGIGPVKVLAGGEEALAAAGLPTEDRRSP